MIETKVFLIAAVLIVLTAPVLAELPSDAVSICRGSADYSINRTIINPNDPGFIWGNPRAIDLTSLDSEVFESPSFQMTPGGVNAGIKLSNYSGIKLSIST